MSPEASPAGGNAPEDIRVSATAYLYTMLQEHGAQRAAARKAADVAHFAERAALVKAAFNERFLDRAAGYYRGAGDRGYRQTHNVLAVAFGLTPDAETSSAWSTASQPTCARRATRSTPASSAPSTCCRC